MRTLDGTPVILYAEDDDGDFHLVSEALKAARFAHLLLRFRDGEDLLDYFFARGRHLARRIPAAPHVLLLDLDMPGMGGREVLAVMRAHPCLSRLPVVVFSGSELDGGVPGANSSMRKPLDYRDLRASLAAFEAFWLGAAVVPPLLGLPEPASEAEAQAPESD